MCPSVYLCAGVSLCVCRVYICALHVSLGVYACVCDAPMCVCVCTCTRAYVAILRKCLPRSEVLAAQRLREVSPRCHHPHTLPIPQSCVPRPSWLSGHTPNPPSPLHHPAPLASPPPSCLGSLLSHQPPGENLNLSGAPHPLLPGLLVFVLPTTPSLGLCPEFPRGCLPTPCQAEASLPSHSPPHAVSMEITVVPAPYHKLSRVEVFWSGTVASLHRE